MSYTKKTWTNGELLDADKMNHIEGGVYDNAVTTTTVSNGVASFKNAAGTELFTLNIPSAYTKLGSHEFTINQTSTSATSIGAFTITPATDIWTSEKIIFISIRDKAGKRNGYFLGTDNLIMNQHPANGSSDGAVTNIARMLYKVEVDGSYATYANGTYGVYVYDINSTGRIRVYARYNGTNSLTINGTFVVDVYALDYPDVSPYI